MHRQQQTNHGARLVPGGLVGREEGDDLTHTSECLV